MLCVGKVAVKKEDLQKYHGKDTWFQLQPVSADSEVQVGTERKLTHITHFNNKALSFHLVFFFSLVFLFPIFSRVTTNSFVVLVILKYCQILVHTNSFLAFYLVRTDLY